MKSLILAIVLLSSAAYSQTNTVRGGAIKEGYVVTITNLSGEVLKDIKIKKIMDSRVVYMFYGSETRGGSIKFKEMSEGDRSKFGYDVLKDIEAENKELVGNILVESKRNLDKDELLRKSTENIARQDLINTKMACNVGVFQKTTEGMLVRSFATQELIFLMDCPNEPRLADEEVVNVTAYHMGLYKYSTVNNSEKTVQRYTCDLGRALSFRINGQ